MLVTIITCTGSRPEAFARAELQMQRQTYKGPIDWIVVDDSEPQTIMTIPKTSNIKQHYFRGPVLWTPSINTQRPNMHEALLHVNPESTAILVAEDDDFYAPDYIETLLFLLNRYDCVGEANNKYYAIKSRSYKEWKNLGHASLCSTGLRYSQYQILYDAVNSGELFMDMAFWRKALERNTKSVLFIGLNVGVGIKQMPGRHGIGAGHDPEGQGFIKDPGFDMLRRWIPLDEDFNYYKAMGSRPDADSPGLLIQKNYLTTIDNASKKIENSVNLFRR
jgi:hypothetical protein